MSIQSEMVLKSVSNVVCSGENTPGKALCIGGKLAKDLQFLGAAVTGRGTKVWAPHHTMGVAIRVWLMGNRCQSENFLPTGIVRILPDTHSPQAYPATLTSQVTKHLRGMLSGR